MLTAGSLSTVKGSYEGMRCDKHTLRHGVHSERLSITVRHLVIYIEEQSFSLVIVAVQHSTHSALRWIRRHDIASPVITVTLSYNWRISWHTNFETDCSWKSNPQHDTQSLCSCMSFACQHPGLKLNVGSWWALQNVAIAKAAFKCPITLFIPFLQAPQSLKLPLSVLNGIIQPCSKYGECQAGGRCNCLQQ